jgi:protein-L-isoaspartate(D-aspartate) O-methyltransferase
METSVERAHFNMVEQQVRPWDVTDRRVLEVMAAIPREQFVPDAYRSLAYADIEIPIAAGQVMLQPKIVGRMLQALQVRPDDRILEIGTGTGYATACLAKLGGPLVSLEIHGELAGQARTALDGIGLKPVEVQVADALASPAAGDAFDVIAITGSLPDVEALPRLEAQLAPNGRLFVVLGEDPLMEATLVTRGSGDSYRRQGLFETSVPALENAPRPDHFVF